MTRTLGLGVILTLAACAGTGGSSNGGTDTQQVVEQPEISLECRTQPGSEAVSERKSPFDSTRITVGTQTAQVCYGRPSAQGRVIFGADGTAAGAPLVPYGKLWRTGANEPTILHLPFAAELAGIALTP